MDLGELKVELQTMLSLTPGRRQQDFTPTILQSALNKSYTREVNLAKNEGLNKYFLATQDITWSSGEVTLAVPKFMQRTGIISILDVTGGGVGSAIQFSDNGFPGGIFWADRKTLQYSTSGPGSDLSLRIRYFVIPEVLQDDGDIPDILPDDYHDLIVWTAAIRLRRIADGKAPVEWGYERDELRMDYHKYISRGRPNSDVPWISPSDTDMYSR